MKDQVKSKAQLIDELVGLRQRIAELERAQTERETTQQEIWHSEERYRLISELVSDLAYAFRVEPDGTLVREWVTDAFVRITGYTPEELDARGGWAAVIHPDDLAAAEQHVEKLLSGRKDVYQLRIIARDGELRWLRDYGRPVWDERQRRVVGIVGAARDITARMRAEEELKEQRTGLKEMVDKRTTELAEMNERLQREIAKRAQVEEALRAGEEQYRMLFESSPESITLLNPEGIILDYNEATHRIAGTPIEGMIGKPFIEFDILDEEDMPMYLEVFSRLVDGEEVEPVEIKVRGSDNDGRWLEVFPSLLKKDGVVQAVQVITRDISERKRMQDEIRSRNERLSALNAVSAAAVSSLELDRVLRQILRHTCQALDAAEGSILLRAPDTDELFFAVTLTDATSGLRQQRIAPGQGIAGWVVQHRQPVCVNDVRRDPRWYEGVDAAVGFETRSLLCAPLMHREEITGVIQTVNKHEGEFSDEDLSLLVAVASIAAAALENARLYNAAQARVQELALLNEISLAITSTLDHATVIHAALSQIQRLYRAEGVSLLQPDLQTGELFFVRTLSRTAPVEIPIRLSPGEGLAGWAFEHQQAVLVKDAQNDPRFSARVDRHLGRKTRALMAIPLLTAENVVGVVEVVGRQVAVFTQDDLRTLQAIASILSVALVNARLYSEQKRLLEERERAQAQLIHSEKMAALGRLSASIAHEINNPLQAIQGCLTLVNEEMDGAWRQEKLTRYLGIVGSEIERIASIVGRMRGFYRPTSEGRVTTDVHNTLESVLELSNKQLQHGGVLVKRDWAAELPQIWANPDHLKQVFLNLVLNAIDAMPEGGTLRISTTLDQLRPDEAPSKLGDTIPLVNAVRVDVSDTGVGMAPQIQSRLFEPFFTTKPNGTGLGLSISYGIIESHQGHIRVESREGVGTTFTILLPTALNTPAGGKQE